MAKRLTILHEDNHLLAVAKPADMPTMGAEPGVVSVVDRAKEYLAQKYQKEGKVFLGVVSRLDSPVTGVLLFARTSKAASRLTEAFKQRKVEKRYLATVTGEVPPSEGTVVHYLKKDDRNARVFVTQTDAVDAQRAELTYEVLLSRGGKSLLAVQLITGRKHQIRVQLAKLGCPVLGDTKYGSPEPHQPGIALHAWRLGFEHPVKREPIRLACKPATRWGYWDEKVIAPVLAAAKRP